MISSSVLDTGMSKPTPQVALNARVTSSITGAGAQVAAGKCATSSITWVLIAGKGISRGAGCGGQIVNSHVSHSHSTSVGKFSRLHGMGVVGTAGERATQSFTNFHDARCRAGAGVTCSITGAGSSHVTGGAKAGASHVTAGVGDTCSIAAVA